MTYNERYKKYDYTTNKLVFIKRFLKLSTMLRNINKRQTSMKPYNAGLLWVKFNLLLCLLVPFSLLGIGDGHALTFSSADNDFVDIGSVDWGLSSGNEMSISAWVRWDIIPANSNNNWANIIANNSNLHSDQGQFWLQHDNLNKHLEFAVNGNSRSFIISNTLMEKDVWYHVVGVYDDDASNSLKIYINGVLDNEGNNVSGNITAFAQEYITTLGHWAYPPSYRGFDGTVDEITLWSRALSSDEVAVLMADNLPANTSGLLAYWDFDTNAGDQVVDRSGNGYGGTVYGADYSYSRAYSGTATTLQDNDNDWYDRNWADHSVYILQGPGIGQSAKIASNSETVLNLTGTWSGSATSPNTSSYYAISDNYKWTTYITTQNQQLVGPSGKQLKITITSLPDDSNHLLASYNLALPKGLMDDETIPAGFSARGDFSWIIDDVGTVTENLVFDYSTISGISDPSQVELLHRDDKQDMTWTEVSESSRDDVARTFTVNGVNVGGEYTLASKKVGDIPSPVVLSSFDVFEKNNVISLSWASESEVECLGYVIERRSEEDLWETLADYLDHAVLEVSQNSTETKYYEINDLSAVPGISYQYRLAFVSSDGKKSDLATSEYIILNSLEDVSLSPAYPNPFNPNTRISFSVAKEGAVRVSIFNSAGYLVEELMNETLSVGAYSISWNASSQAAGLYFIRLQSKDNMQIQKCILLK